MILEPGKEKLKELLENKDILEKICKRQDDCLERERLNRTQKESHWEEIRNAAILGKINNGNDAKGSWGNLKDYTYPELSQSIHSNLIAFFHKNFFTLSPKGETITPGMLSALRAEEQLYNDALENPHSSFKKAIRAMTWQLVHYNFGVIHYSWQNLPKPQYAKEVSIGQNGTYEYSTLSQEDDLAYQGPLFSFVDVFNFYLDTSGHDFSDINKLNRFWIKKSKYSDVMSDAKYNQMMPYFNNNNVFYRGTRDLEKLKDLTVVESVHEQNTQNTQNSHNSNDPLDRSGDLELRTASLNELKIKEGNQEFCLKNVNLEWAKAGGTIVPLVLEYNPRPYNTPSTYAIRLINTPEILYSDSPLGLALNEHKTKHFYKTTKAELVNRASYPTRVVDVNLFTSAIEDRETMEKYAKRELFGKSILVRLAKTTQQAQDPKYFNGDISKAIYNPDLEEYMNLAPVLEKEIFDSENAMRGISKNFSTGNLAGSTATGVRALQAEQQKSQGEYIKAISALLEWVILNMQIDSRIFFVKKIPISRKISEKEQEEFKESANEQGIEGIFEKVEPIYSNAENFFPFVSKYNSFSKRVTEYLSSDLLKKIESSIEINVKPIDEVSPEALQALASAAQGSGDATLELLYSIQIFEAFKDKLSPSIADNFAKILDQKAEKVLNPQPDPREEMLFQQQVQKNQAETENISSKTALNFANANEEQSRADQTNVKTQRDQEERQIIQEELEKQALAEQGVV